MLDIIIPEQHYEFYDDINEVFLPPINVKETKIQIEHSLISIRKWEQKWQKPFLQNVEKTYEEITDYIRCMTLTHGIDPEVYRWIPKSVIKEVIEYINNPMTATWFSDNNLVGAQKNSRETVTAEIIYYWMIALNIPIEFQKWHLNQLLTLIKVVNIKNGKPKKMNKRDAARERAALNKKRREQFNSNG